MKKIVGVSFKDVGKIYWFSPNFLNLKKGDKVVVETIRGQELGKIVQEVKEVDEATLDHELKPVIRLASEKDIKNYEHNNELARKAYIKAKQIIENQKLQMKTLSCEYTLDSSKLLIYYTAEGRVDFRELVKILASEFRVRIELRQIGPREGAKLIGGLGPCGRPLCCSNHIREFDLVTMKMAKDQGMTLSASKIAGLCGKLMCCIAYENEAYCAVKKTLPYVGDIVLTPNGDNCKVISVNCLSKKITVDNNGLNETWDHSKLKVIKTNHKDTNKKSIEELELEKELESQE